MKMPENKYRNLALICLLIVFADQLTKWVVSRSVRLFDVVAVIPGCVNLVHVRNPGGAFGFFAHQGGNIRSLLFILVSSGAVVLVLYLYYKTPQKYTMLLTGLALIIGGALGNMIDRLRFGHVVDFIDLYVGNLHWPAFNVADSAITVGMVIFAGCILFRKMPE